MRDIKLKSTYQPRGLMIGIEPTNGEMIEASLICEVTVEGHQFRHDIWWADMPLKTRKKIQSIIVEAIDELMNEEAVHTTKGEDHSH